MKVGLFQLISKYRTELMGYAILGVFICHVVMRTQLNSILLHEIPRFVYTQGFLFLSGFGLYYSFSSDGNLMRYFIKRIRRLYIPYFLMSLPFFIIIVWVTHQTLFDFLGYLTTLVFWVKGNFYGMWYIAVTIFLYVVFPPMFKWMFRSQTGGVFWRYGVLLACMLMVLFILNSYFHDYYALIGKWVNKTLMFPTGMLCGYLCKSGIVLKKEHSIILMTVLAVLYMVTIVKPFFFKEHVRCLWGIFLLSFLFAMLENSLRCQKILSILHWLGTYSLELYVLHVLIFKTIDACIFLSEPYKVMLLSIALALLVCKPVHIAINNLENRILNI